MSNTLGSTFLAVYTMTLSDRTDMRDHTKQVGGESTHKTAPSYLQTTTTTQPRTTRPFLEAKATANPGFPKGTSRLPSEKGRESERVFFVEALSGLCDTLMQHMMEKNHIFFSGPDGLGKARDTHAPAPNSHMRETAREVFELCMSKERPRR